jgi:NAD(P)-dependent dehydrogenase (short-subunit alcohol dehydrogenase family)
VVVNDTGGSMKGQGIDSSHADEVVREIKSAGGEATASTASVSTPEGGGALIKETMDRYGRIDILIHNAGIVRSAPLDEMTQEDFDAVLDVHLRGAFHVVRPAFAQMRKAGYGRVVLTSSIGGLYGNHNVANYGVAKAGMIGLSNVVALEGAANDVKCNLIVPGAVTRMAEGIDVSKYPPMTAEMVAPVVAWLAHETCSITGEMLISIAGRVARACIAESPGVYRESWSIEQVAEDMDAIRNTSVPFIPAVVPHGHVDHIRFSFEMAARGAGASGRKS